jgi:hypothetical protein
MSASSLVTGCELPAEAPEVGAERSLRVFVEGYEAGPCTNGAGV